MVGWSVKDMEKELMRYEFKEMYEEL